MKKYFKSQFMKDEQKELSLFLIGVGTVLGTWLILSGGWPNFLLTNHDGVLFLPKWAQHFKLQSWQDYIYAPDYLGGAIFADMFGKLPIYDLLSKFDLSAQTIMNIALMINLLLLGYFGVKCAAGLSRTWGRKDELHIVSICGLFLIFAFLPIMGSRVQYGHVDFPWGLTVFLILVSTFLSMKLREITVTYLVLAVFTLWQTFPTSGHQIKLYSVVFGGPIMIGLFWDSQFALFKEWVKKNRLVIFLCSGGLLAGLLVSLPRFIGLLDFAISGEGTRAIGDAGVPAVYSYPGTQLVNYFSSILWNYKLTAQTDDVLLISESFFPVGPLIVLLFLVPKKWRRPAIIGLAVSALLSICLSLKVWPINQILIDFVPMLKSFRVPERSFMPFCTSIAILGSAVLLFISESRPRFKSVVLMFGGVFLILLTSGFTREILLWGVASAVVYGVINQRFKLLLNAPTLLILFGVGSVTAFNVWRTPPGNFTPILNKYEKISQQIKSQVPDLKSPLTRVFLNYLDNHFNIVTSSALNLSTVSGYSMPLRRFSELFSELEKLKLSPGTTVFRVNPDSRSAKVFSGLYNICCEINISKEGSVQVNRISSVPNTPVWSSSEAVIHQSMQSVAQDLLNNQGAMAIFLRDKILFNLEDELIKKYFDKKQNLDLSECASLKPEIVSPPENRQEFEVAVGSRALCPISFATNYSSRFHAYEVRNGRAGEKLTVLPSYGAITTVMVPAGVDRILLRIEPYMPTWAKVFGVIGWLLLIGLGYGVYYLKKQTTSSAISRSR